MTPFRPRLTECEDRITPASPAEILAELPQTVVNASLLQRSLAHPQLLSEPGAKTNLRPLIDLINQQSIKAAADLNEFLTALQIQGANNPHLGVFLAPYIARTSAAVQMATANIGFAQFVLAAIDAGGTTNTGTTPGGTPPGGLTGGTTNPGTGLTGSTANNPALNNALQNLGLTGGTTTTGGTTGTTTGTTTTGTTTPQPGSTGIITGATNPTGNSTGTSGTGSTTTTTTTTI